MVLEIAKGIDLDIDKGIVSLEALEGKLKVQLALGALVAPVLDKVKADVESGKIDLIKGTSMDQLALVQALEFLKKELGQ